ncbi:aminopeptidase [Thermococcus barophilus]|uniref:Leucyl aminopeptidase n=1 Tax=Thermococcus barophilus (strain DSM 11836 / MP) TaxID=391623 RepID=F0LIM9_THEBM|nr:aminopeptidase [Thermococcus barophilus]ADT83303.1 putative leucyl aminopeptidase [Thermococcus barophilus MP]
MKLKDVSKIAMHEVIDVQKGEEVLIITNPGEVLEISLSLFSAAKEFHAKPTIIIQEPKTSLEFAERSVIEAIKSEPDIVISITEKKLGKDAFGLNIGYVGRDNQKYTHIFEKLLWGDRRIRSFWSPGITVDMYLRAVPIDYERLRYEARVLAEILDKGKEVHVATEKGTDLWINIKGRKAFKDDGDFRKPGKGGNLPAGEVFISPAVGKSEGVIVFDGTLGLGGESVLPKNTVKVHVKEGFVQKIEGKEEAKKLEEAIKEAEKRALKMGKEELAKNAWHLGELGIGLNPRAKMSGKLLEDEKLRNTIHIAIGANYDNDAPALNHFDCLILNPTVEVDGERIMEKGKFLLF